MRLLHRAMALGAIALSLTGCASLGENRAPKCSGYDQRPLNKSMWNWDNGSPVAGEANPVTGQVTVKPSGSADIAAAHEAASYRSCSTG